MIPFRRTGICSPCLLALTAGLLLAAPATRHARRVLQVPHGPLTQLASPAGRYLLFGLPYQAGVRPGPELWIRDKKTGEQRLLFPLSGTAHAEWAPDGSAFYVSDHLGSDRTLSYIYDASGSARLDVFETLLKADARLRPFTTGHVYVDALKWLDSRTILVSYFGHTDEPPIRCFVFRYTVTRDGAVRTLSRRVTTIKDIRACPGP